MMKGLVFVGALVGLYFVFRAKDSTLSGCGCGSHLEGVSEAQGRQRLHFKDCAHSCKGTGNYRSCMSKCL